MTLSVCIIAHDEEAKLQRTLQSVRFADEVIVVDCQSSDYTAQIATAAGAKVFTQPNLPNLNINKNFSFDQAQCDWVLCLDADEIMPTETSQEIIDILRHQSAEAAFYLPRRNYYFGRWLKHGGHYPDWQLRLFRRGKARFPTVHIHERLQVDGTVSRLRHSFDHYPYETEQECWNKLHRDTNFESRYLYQRGIRPSLRSAYIYLCWKPGQRFLRRYVLKGGFLDGHPGWKAIQMDMQSFRLRYQKLRELTERELG